MEQVFYSNNIGQGIICYNGEQIDLDAIPVNVADEILIPDTYTSMNGYFKKSLKFKGIYQNNKLVFEIGTDEDIFESKTYYQIINRISQYVLFEKYGERHGRDYRWINGKWN
jgi:hypothetical protein